MIDIIIKDLTLNMAKTIKTFYSRISQTKMDNKSFYIESFKIHFFLLTHYPTWSRWQLLESCLSIMTSLGILNNKEIDEYNSSIWEINI